jgi:ABC-type amino acid transport substrate-binding protein
MLDERRNPFAVLSPAALLCLAVLMAGPAAAHADAGLLAQVKATGVLRVCADPDNLPFSSRDPGEPGYDVEIAGAIAAALGARAELIWVSTVLGRSAIRQLLEGKCDLLMGLPLDERLSRENDRLALSVPYYRLRHVLVSPIAQPIGDLSGLRDQRVAVERVSLGDIFLFQNGQRRHISRSQREAFQAVAHGEAAAAFLWAPIAWWLLKQQPQARLQAVEVSVPDIEFDIGAGLRRGDEAFQAAVNRAVQQLIAQGTVARALARYGVPSPVQTAADLQQGRSLYYQVCAACHGQSAEGGGPVPNLKTFAGSEEQFLKVSLNGRSDRGMPAWKGKLTEDELRSILAFIQSLPK